MTTKKNDDMNKKTKLYNEPDTSLDDIMREDARLADRARNKAYNAQIMSLAAIVLSVLSIVLAALRLLMK